MPTFANYNLSLTDHTNAPVASLSGPSLVAFEWSHVLNSPGVFKAIFVADQGIEDQFKTDYGVLLMRNDAEEFAGIYLGEVEELDSGEVDRHLWAAVGYSGEWLLDQPLVQPLASLNTTWARYDLWWDHGPGDDIMKKMVSESMGGGAIAARQFGNVTVEGNLSQGTYTCYEARYARLLDALRDLAEERTNTDFWVQRVTGGWEFRTASPYRGTDRRKLHNVKPTVFSLDNGNMLNPRRTVSRAMEVTVAVGGWQGGGAERDIYERTNATALSEGPYRRREEFYDLRDITQKDVIDSILDRNLSRDGKEETVEFDVLETGGCRYRTDFELGDLCTAELWGKTYDVRIVEVGGRISGPDNAQDEQIVAKAELWTRKELDDWAWANP